MSLLLLLSLGSGWSAAPKVPTGLAWAPLEGALVAARVQTQGFAVVLDAPALPAVRVPALTLDMTATCAREPAGRRQTTVCVVQDVRVWVEAGLSSAVDATLQAWADRWSQATVEVEHTLTHRATRLDVLLPPEAGLGSDAAAHREQTDRLLGAALAQCLAFEVPAAGRGHQDGLSWVQDNLAGVPPLPLRVQVPPSGRWQRSLKRRSPSVSAQGSAAWAGGHIEDSVLVYTLTDGLDGDTATVAHTCRVMEELPNLGPSGRVDRLPSLPAPQAPPPRWTPAMQ